ncbi:alpha/beta hydrolase [Parvularcula sp. LCG005]|uniref:alpha/beta fold hydrolase n=1 Tax=Parvularcula sp. LCG005 TaxID=3078805 RepID=UPI002943CBEC|nr:alpha/beta hydrolase [Parvularcula sp. LCG005]WOI52155.1 alpha/beta hydrolase [Parvularcula sp. LCG005]
MRLFLRCAATALLVSLAHAQPAEPLSPNTDVEARYTEASDQFVPIGEATVRIRTEGPQDGYPVILLHGFTFSLETWDQWADALSPNFKVIRYDLMGHGLTGPDPQERYSPEERAATIGDVMDALDIEEAVIVGNSLGGLAAWRFAADHPERVKRLVLVSPGAYAMNGVADEPVPVPPALAYYLREVPEVGLRASIGRIYSYPDRISADRLQTLYDMMKRPGNGDAFVKSIEEFVLPDPAAALAKVTSPTLLLWGTEDKVIPVDHAGRLLGHLPNAQLVLYPGIGHVPQEESAKSIRDVKAFLYDLK